MNLPPEKLIEQGALAFLLAALVWTLGRVMWYVARRLLDKIDEKDCQLATGFDQRAEAAAKAVEAIAINTKQMELVTDTLKELAETLKEVTVMLRERRP